MPVRPLIGIRVIDLAVDRGELCGRLLSDLGAEVIKVEPPEGSPSRSLPPLDPLTPEHSLFFTMRNCGKRSVVIDPGNAASMADFESLLASADVLIGSAEPGARRRQQDGDHEPSQHASHRVLLLCRSTMASVGLRRDARGSGSRHSCADPAPARVQP